MKNVNLQHPLKLMLGASALVLASCGGDDEPASTNEPTETAAAVETAQEAATEAEDVADEAATTAEAVMNDAADTAETMADDVAEAAETATAEAEGAMADMATMAEDAQADAAQVMSDAMASATDAAQDAADAVAGATVHEIMMYNADPDNPRERMVFIPDLVVAKPGDTIRFVPSDPTHQSSSINGMLPDGVEGWQGKVNKGVDYVVSAPGIYGYRCVPHYAAGMVGMVIVEGEGMMANVEAAKGERHVGLAKRRFDAIWERAEAEYLN